MPIRVEAILCEWLIARNASIKLKSAINLDNKADREL